MFKCKVGIFKTNLGLLVSSFWTQTRSGLCSGRTKKKTELLPSSASLWPHLIL